MVADTQNTNINVTTVKTKRTCPPSATPVENECNFSNQIKLNDLIEVIPMAVTSQLIPPSE